MCESLGKGPRPNATLTALHYRNSKIAPSGVWHQPVGIWSFSARRNRPNAKRRRLASWFDLGTKSGWSTAISTALCGAVATAGANRGRNTGGSEGLPLDPTGGSAAAVCPPAHRQRVCGEPQRRLIDCCCPSTAAVVGAGRVLSISCTCAKVTPESEQTVSRASELEVWR